MIKHARRVNAESEVVENGVKFVDESESARSNESLLEA